MIVYILIDIHFASYSYENHKVFEVIDWSIRFIKNNMNDYMKIMLKFYKKVYVILLPKHRIIGRNKNFKKMENGK